MSPGDVRVTRVCVSTGCCEACQHEKAKLLARVRVEAGMDGRAENIIIISQLLAGWPQWRGAVGRGVEEEAEGEKRWGYHLPK